MLDPCHKRTCGKLDVPCREQACPSGSWCINWRKQLPLHMDSVQYAALRDLLDEV